MKKIKKIKPSWYNLDKIENYINLRGADGQILSRWNTKTKHNSDFKDHLIALTNGECVFCGKYLDDWDVEHYLPKTIFNYLTYSYNNLFPCCTECNQKLKKTYYPPSLNNQRFLADHHCINCIPNVTLDLYDKNKFLLNNVERLVEPSFDNPEDHLFFSPLTCQYEYKSLVGKKTVEMFFSDNRNFTKKLQELSHNILLLVSEGKSLEEVKQLYSVQGYSYHIEKLYNYWKDFV